MKTHSPPKTATGACLCDIMDITALPDALGTHTGGTISQLRAPPPQRQRETHGIHSSNIYVQMEHVTLKQLIFLIHCLGGNPQFAKYLRDPEMRSSSYCTL